VRVERSQEIEDDGELVDGQFGRLQDIPSFDLVLHEKSSEFSLHYLLIITSWSYVALE
jgi:hypothetical protein